MHGKKIVMASGYLEQSHRCYRIKEKMNNKNIVIIDYGMGNTGSIDNALQYLGSSCVVSNKKEDIVDSKAIILPGVGSFSTAMNNLIELDLISTLTTTVSNDRIPFLGICLGMQLLAQDSVEGGYTRGLGWIEGHVRKIKSNKDLKLPHVGWNNIKISKGSKLFENIDNDANFYFDHSYELICDEKLDATRVEYGKDIISTIQKQNIWATQFHPEKSQRNGLKILRNFLNYVDSTNNCNIS